MSKSGYGRLSTLQAAAVIGVVVLGHQVITMPRSVAESAGEGAWLSVLIGAGLAVGGLLLIYLVHRRVPGVPFATVCRAGLGWLAWPVCIGMAAVWTLQIGLQTREYSEIVAANMLPRTPQAITVILILISAVFLVLHDLRILGRVSEIYVVFAALVLLAGPLGAVGHLRWLFFQPVWGNGPAAVAEGGRVAFQHFLGLDLAFVFFPYLLRPRTGLVAGAQALAGAGLVHLFLTTLAIGVLGPAALLDFVWPVLELVKLGRVPGTILERLEAPFLAVGTAAVFNTAAAYLFGASLLLQHLFGLRSHRPAMWGVVAAAFAVSQWPVDVEGVIDWIVRLGGVMWFTVWLLPVLLLLRLRGRRGDALRQGKP